MSPSAQPHEHHDGAPSSMLSQASSDAASTRNVPSPQQITATSPRSDQELAQVSQIHLFSPWCSPTCRACRAAFCVSNIWGNRLFELRQFHTNKTGFCPVPPLVRSHVRGHCQALVWSTLWPSLCKELRLPLTASLLCWAIWVVRHPSLDALLSMAKIRHLTLTNNRCSRPLETLLGMPRDPISSDSATLFDGEVVQTPYDSPCIFSPTSEFPPENG
jgi:hypothetical protein